MSAHSFPTLRIRDGVLERHGRWDHSRALLDGTLAELAPRLRQHGFPGVHALFVDGLGEANRRALGVLAKHFQVLFAEGGIADAAGCAAAIAEGANAVIVVPEAVDDPAMDAWLEAGNPPPLMAVGHFLDEVVRPKARLALERTWTGLVLDVLAPKETGLIQASVQKSGAELILRMPNLDAGQQVSLLDQFLPLDAPLLVDVEFLYEMTRARFEFVHEVFPKR